MKSVGIIFLWALALILLALFSWVLVLYLDWPLWSTMVFFLLSIGCYFLVKFIRRLWIFSRSRAKLALSELDAKQIPDAKKRAIADLAEKWRHGIRLLQHSTLRKYGNPRYALPWYVVLGQSGSGKTSAIAESRLGVLIDTADPNAPISPTESIQWWFFNEGVFLDLSGRYVSEAQTEADKDEWNKLLHLLSVARFREGISGLVLTLDASQLLGANNALLGNYAALIRQRIDELIRLFDRRFPIYLLITKCDQIAGFNHWSRALSETDLSQAVGYLGIEEEGPGAEDVFLGNAWSAIEARLKDIRLELAMRGVETSAELLSFPNEVDRMKQGVEAFVRSALGYSTYMEQPFLRGLYLSSAQAEVGLIDQLTAASRETAHEKRGVFLQDLFSKILPADRYLERPTILVNRWRALTRNIALAAWTTLCIGIVGFLLLSFVQTEKEFHKITDAFPDEHVLSSTSAEDQIVVVLAMKKVVDFLVEDDSRLETSWFAFSQNIADLQNDIKADFVRRINVIRGWSNSPFERYDAALAGDDVARQADVVVLLTRQINLIQARMNGATYKDLKKLPQVPVDESIRLGSFFAESLGNNYSNMYTAYIAWLPSNDDSLRSMVAERRQLLNQFLSKEQQYAWLLYWAEAQQGVYPVTLRDFWLPNSSGSDAVRVRGAMTKKGSEYIQTLLEELSLAFNDSQEYRIRRAAFERWYWSERKNAWQTLAWSFPDGMSLLPTEQEWRDMLSKVGTESGPYFQFIDRLNAEFNEVPKENLPDWLVFSREVGKYKEQQGTRTNLLRKILDLFDAINLVGGQSMRGLASSGALPLPSEIKKTMSNIEAYRKYGADFSAASADAVSGDGRSLELLSDFFNSRTTGDSKTSSLLTAYDSFIAFKKSSTFDSAQDQVMWNLLAGPMQMLVRYTAEQASCALQRDWEKSVLFGTQMTVSAKELSKQLYGTEGSVWAFLDGPAKPFVNQSINGFRPVRFKEFTFPFTADFMPYLNRAMAGRVEQIVRDQRAESAKGKTAKMTITGRPLGVNPGAKAKPYAAIFSLQCNSGEIILNNFNTAATETLTWSPETCGDASLQIKIDNMTLTRRYPGPMGLARFVEEFGDGERVFTPLDFPSVKSKLDALGVKSISVRYDLAGKEPVLQLADSMAHLSESNVPALMLPALARRQIPVPQRIGQCWSQGGPDEAPTSVLLLIQSKAQQVLDQANQPITKAEVSKTKPAEAASEPKPVATTARANKRKSHSRVNRPQQPPVQAVVQQKTLFYIQVGVFSSANNLRAVETQLLNLGVKVQLEPMSGDMTGAQRVLAGPFQTKEAANVALNRITMLGMGGLIVKRTTSSE